MCCDWYLTLPAAMLSLITTRQVFLQSIQSLLTFDLVLSETAYAQFVVIKTVFVWTHRLFSLRLFYISMTRVRIDQLHASQCKTLQTNFIQRNWSKCIFKIKKTVNKNTKTRRSCSSSHVRHNSKEQVQMILFCFLNKKRHVCKMYHATAKQGTLQ